MEPEVSDDRSESLAIHVRVARGGCDTLMAQEGLHVAQVGSALVEEQRRGRMPQGMRGNHGHPRTLTGELEACVEGLVAKGRAVPARKDERGSREVDSPSPPQPNAFDAFQEGEPLLERVRQFFCERQIAKRAAFDLEADGDNHSTRLTHQPIEGQESPLVVSATGEKERGGEVVCQVAEVAALILAQFAQQLAQLGGSVVAQLGFLGGKLRGLAVDVLWVSTGFFLRVIDMAVAL